MRTLIPLWAILVVATSASGQDEPEDTREFPKREEMVVPSMKDLLAALRKDGTKQDWVVLDEKEERVVVTQTVTPRPNTLKVLEEKRTKLLAEMQGKPADVQKKLREERGKLEYIDVILLDDPEKAYRLKTDKIKEIIYHEDLMLLRIDELIKEENLRAAYEMLYTLDQVAKNWKGSAERQQDLLFKQAQIEIRKNRPEEALVHLDTIYSRNKNYNQLSETAGNVIDGLMTAAYEKSNYRKARYFWEWLNLRDEGHGIATKWRGKLDGEARALMKTATDQTASKKHAEAVITLDKAAKIWPRSNGLQSQHARAVQRFQTVHAGVLDRPGRKLSYFLPTDADRRIKHLLESRLFELSYFDGSPHYRSDYFERWLPKDLGRQTEFHLRPDRRVWESRPDLTSQPVIRSLLRRLDPKHKDYDERLAHYVKSLSIQSPYQFSINFKDVPLRIEAMLARSIWNRTKVDDAQDAPAGMELMTPRFVAESVSEDRAVYRRKIPQSENIEATAYRAAEVVEHYYKSEIEALRALLRGEVHVLPRVSSDKIGLFDVDGSGFFVKKYGLPLTHVIQVNPNRRVVMRPELRRALSYSVNRRAVLNKFVLNDSKGRYGRVVSGPFPSSSDANSPDVGKPLFDPALAFALTLAAKKKFKDEKIPKLKMIVSPEPGCRAAAEAMIKTWKRLEIPVELVPEDAPTPDDWDLIYRTVRMPEPLTQLLPFLTLGGKAKLQAMTHLPDWLRRELVQLDQAENWETGRKALHRLHRYLVLQAEIIPLWEVDEFMVYRANTVEIRQSKNFQGVPSGLLHPYQNIERWLVKPWFPLSAN